MEIQEKQARSALEKPLFQAEFIHSHLLPFFNFNENTGDYEIKSELVNKTDDEDRKVAYETLNTGWAMWLRAKRDAKAQAVPEGFILMPKVPTERMVNATRGKHEGAPYLPYSIYEAFVEQAMIEAQEQKG